MEKVSTPEGLSTTAVAALSAGEITVSSYSELKSVLTVAPTATTIVLTGDIQMTTAGIAINAAWTELIIDGKDPNTGAIHTITDAVSSSYSSTIHPTSGNLKNITLQNLTLDGKNYYGPISVLDGYTGVVLTYQNINYTGPQITYNRDGTVRYIDSTIHIEKNNGASAAQEVAEMTNVVLGGTTTIVSNSTSDSVFWFRNTSGSFTVLDNAVVSIITANYGCYMNSTNVDLSIGKNASFDYSGNGGMTYGTMYFKSVIVELGGSFSAVKNDATAYAVLRVGSKLSVIDGASLTLLQNNSSSPALHMAMTGSEIQFESPKKVWLIAPKGNALQVTGSGVLNITTETINLWNTLPSGSMDSISSLPTQIWNQKDGSNFVTTATVTGFKTSNVSTDWSGEATQWNTDLSQISYTFATTKAILFGTHQIDVNSIKDGDATISGTVEPNAEVEIYNVDTKIGVATADGNESFSAPVNTLSISEGTVLSILTSSGETKAYTFSTVSAGGTIAFVSVPSELSFGTVVIPDQPTYVYREVAPWVIEVSDTRGSGSTWRIDVSAESPLSDASGNQLDSPVVFVSPSSSQVIIDSTITIYEGTTGSSSDILLEWSQKEGPILWIKSISDIISGTTYSATIEWSLVDAP